MVKFTSLYSGSSKNASVFTYKNTNILIDCGGSFKQIREQLDKIDLKVTDIDALFITHPHTDHISALSMIINKTDIPIYASYGTHEEIFDKSINMPMYRRIIIPDEKEFEVKDIVVSSFKTPHDTKYSLGFNFQFGKKTASYATDIGYISENFFKCFKGRDFMFFESNHDVDMLINSNRPESLKHRILGDNGHLSNENSAFFSSLIANDGLKRLMLGHLSGEANTPELAYKVTKDKMESKNIKIDKDLLLWVAKRDMISEMVSF